MKTHAIMAVLISAFLLVSGWPAFAQEMNKQAIWKKAEDKRLQFNWVEDWPLQAFFNFPKTLRLVVVPEPKAP